jgi:hypothetical protein
VPKTRLTSPAARSGKFSARAVSNVIASPASDSYFIGHAVYRQTPTRTRLDALRFAADWAYPASVVPYANRFLSLSFAIRDEDALKIESGALLFGFAPANYYHWTINILPKAHLFCGHLKSERLPLLVSEQIPRGAAREALNCVNTDGLEVLFLPNQLLKVQETWILEAPAFAVSGLKNRRARDFSKLGDFSGELLANYRDQLMSRASPSNEVRGRPRI